MLTHLVLICAVASIKTPVVSFVLKAGSPSFATPNIVMKVTPDAGVSTGASIPAVKPGTDGGHLVMPIPGSADAGHSAALLPVNAFTMTPDVKALVERVQGFYEKTTDFSADFKQDYTYKAFKRTQTSTGTVIFRKPGLMRWEYEKPAKKTFVLAGDRVYAYDPEAQLLTRASIGTNKLSASVTFLFGQGKLADEFAITQKECKTCTGTLLVLNPLKPDARFQRVLLEVDPKTSQVLKSTVIDPDGSENAISFLNLKTNVGIDEKAFKLTPPPGTQVQDFTQGAGSPTGGAAPMGIGATVPDAGKALPPKVPNPG